MNCPHCSSNKVRSAVAAVGSSMAAYMGKSHHCSNCGQFFNVEDTEKELSVAPLPGSVKKDI